MRDWKVMSPESRTYWAVLVSAGVASSVYFAAHWSTPLSELGVLLLYVIAAVLVSGLKLRIPGVLATLSPSYIVIIGALLTLSPAPCIIVGLASVVAQCVIHSNSTPKPIRVIFNMAAVTLAIAAAHLVFQISLLSRLDHTGCLALILASLVYYSVNTLAVAAMIGFANDTPFLEVWRKSYLWTFPQYLVGGCIAGSLHLLNMYIGWLAFVLVVPPLYLIFRSWSVHVGRVEEQQTHIREMADLHLRTIETLALAIDAKDDTTAAHLRRVQVYAAEIGRELNLSDSEMQALNAAALLHDVGKLAVPEYIISKPGKLTPEEFEKMKVHPVVGAELLERVQFPYPVVPIVRHHHEKFDGTGYPDGLAGDEIPVGARILSVVDCLDALASDRQYRRALPLEDAMRIVAGESGKAFDPTIVGILQRRFRELESKAKAETADVAKLSSNVRIERGAAPAAGFAEASAQTLPAPAGFNAAVTDANREFQLIREITSDLGSSLRLDETLALLAVRLERLVEHNAVVLYLRDGQCLVPRFVKGESFRFFSGLRIPVGEGLSGWVAENDRVIVNGNPAVESGYLQDERRVTALRSAISVPLWGRHEIVGVLTLYHLKADAFTQDHKRVLCAINRKAGLAIENSLSFEKAQNAAETDPLTGLQNARALFNSVHQKIAACGDKDSFSVVVMDLDGFKDHNDRYGHMAGNRILDLFAQSLTRNLRPNDVAARFGGDEFCLLMDGSGPDAVALLKRADQFAAAACADAGCDGSLRVSCGVASYPQDGSTPEALIEKADARMYEEKRGRRLQRVA